MAVTAKSAKKKVLPVSELSERANTRGRQTKTPRRRGPVDRQYIAIDLHRRRSVIVRMTKDGDKLDTVWPAAARGSQGFAMRAAMAETVSPGGRTS